MRSRDGSLVMVDRLVYVVHLGTITVPLRGPPREEPKGFVTVPGIYVIDALTGEAIMRTTI